MERLNRHELNRFARSANRLGEIGKLYLVGAPEPDDLITDQDAAYLLVTTSGLLTATQEVLRPWIRIRK